MQFLILKDDVFINKIEANYSFCEEYCRKNGYTYKLMENEETPTPDPSEEPPKETQVLGREITDLNLEQIAMGQEITELQLMFMEGGKAVV